MSRGVDVVEATLNKPHRYTSGPQWLAENVLHDRHVIAVAGTHGKTTTASMLAWILEDAGLKPGFLIGGIPANFGTSARFGESRFFVVEADEYDTAFFDKRAKFVHYRPRTVILNNLEYDHADIYKNVAEILWQFHQLIRMVPSDGQIIAGGNDENLKDLLDMGCWTPVQTFGTSGKNDWTGSFRDNVERHIGIRNHSGEAAETRWRMGGSHNLENALAAVAGAVSLGVAFASAVDALSRFKGVKRRMERTATVANIAIYDDFAHHPTSIQKTIESMRRRYPGHRVVVAMEPRSNTMKLGVHNDALADSLKNADLVWMFRPDDMDDGFDASLESLGDKLSMHRDYDQLVNDMSTKVLGGDQIIFMSNGGFGSARQTLTAILQRTRGS
jgi:UDP-N-acetylmuramate: L-alanyl-gamma-D-glutamyl-meso-diaminopimelate ligase